MATSVLQQFDPYVPYPIIDVPNNSDLDNYKTTGFYYVKLGAAQSGSHMPAQNAFALIVFAMGSNCLQLAFRSSQIYTRGTGSSGWNAWKSYTGA